MEFFLSDHHRHRFPAAADPPENPPPPPPPPPKAKTSRRSSRSSSAPKKAPQRGLGVAQLELLRCQQTLKTPDINLTPYDAVPQPPRYGTPLAFGISGADLYDGYFVPSPVALLGSGGGGGAFFTAAAAVPAFVEPPSNQKPAACFSDPCEFCQRKRLMFGADPAMSVDVDLAATMAVDQTMMRSYEYDWYEKRGLMMMKMAADKEKEKEVKEYDFFPHFPTSSAVDSVDVAASDRMAGPPHFAANYIDLSLKL